MAPNLTSGAFKIVSLIDGNPSVGVNFTRPAFQFVHLNGPVTNWRVEEEGDNTYRFSLGGYRYTGVVRERVVASIHPEQNTEWIAIYQERQDAYSILPVDNNGRGWTIADADADITRARIVLRALIVGPSEPPFYPTGQLFRFEAIDE